MTFLGAKGNALHVVIRRPGHADSAPAPGVSPAPELSKDLPAGRCGFLCLLQSGGCSTPCAQTGPAAELRTWLPAQSDQLAMDLNLLLPLLASLQLLPRPVFPEDLFPAPQFTVSPHQTKYVSGQNVTLTCSPAGAPSVSGFRFFKEGQLSPFKELPTRMNSFTDVIQLSGASGLLEGNYTCEFWTNVSDQEKKSHRSQSISIAVAEPGEAPRLTPFPEKSIYTRGADLTLTCSAAGTPSVSGMWFFRGGQDISSTELALPQDGYRGSFHLSNISQSQAGEYSCNYRQRKFGREIPSNSSQPISIAVKGEAPRGPLVHWLHGRVSHPPPYKVRHSWRGENSPAPSNRLSMVISVLLPLLASLQVLPKPVSPTVPLPAPILSRYPSNTAYLPGEQVTLTCSAPHHEKVSGYRFFHQTGQQDPTIIIRMNAQSQLKLTAEKGNVGSYTCAYWRWESHHEISSGNSSSVSITVTAPQLTVSPQQPVYITGENVTLMCSAARAPTVSGVRIFKDGRPILSRLLPSRPYSHTESLLLLRVVMLDAGVYSCEYWRTVFGQNTTSERSQPISIAVTDRPPVPWLTVSPRRPVYITDEAVNMTCSVAGAATVSGIWFFRDGQQIHSKELPSPQESYTDSIQLSGLSGLQPGRYSCESWKKVNGRVIPSMRSRPMSIAVTDPLPTPQLTLSPQHPVYVTGETVTLTCSAGRVPTVSGFRFFRDGQKINSEGLCSPQEVHASSVQLSAISGLESGSYSCECWKIESRRKIPSERSEPISIAVTEPPPPPRLSLDPLYPIYVRGELVTLWCLAPPSEKANGYRFFNQRGEQVSNGVSSQGTWLLSATNTAESDAYTCLYWRMELGREIPSERSYPVPVPVADLLPQPVMSMNCPAGVVCKGLPLLLTCVVPGDAGERRFHFYKDGAKIPPGDLGSEVNTTESDAGPVNVSVLSIPWASLTSTGAFTCAYMQNMSGRWVLSPRSQAMNMTVRASHGTHGIVLITGGAILLLTGALAALLCYFYRKERVLKPLNSTEDAGVEQTDPVT
ncbi:immunoglobulin superfamily member 1-like [Carettochelys insculpta]|uniref:immunoglobulin superfamily member 1-like n=1 Tax=Carettochelys insculpta TaxID=44489 RepID=UPI003EBF00F7